MLISNIHVDNDAQSFETPRINNYSVAAPIAQILLFYDDYLSFETPNKTISQCYCTKCTDCFGVRFNEISTQEHI